MKRNRQEVIKNIISMHDVETQEDLLTLLDKEGFNIISLVYYDPDMQNQLKKAKDRQNKSTDIEFNFEALLFHCNFFI